MIDMKVFARAQVVPAFALAIAMSAGTALAAAPTVQPPTPEQSLRAGFTMAATVEEDALAKANLSDQQRAAAETMIKQVGPKIQAANDANDALIAALADQIEAGAVDENALAGKVDAVAKATEDWTATVTKALVDLHNLLDPQQRVAFADAVESSIKAGAKAPSTGDKTHTLQTDLGLSDDQWRRVQAVLAKLPEPSDERAGFVSVYEAFKKDDFSAEMLSRPADMGAKSRADSEQTIATAKEIAAILTPDQSVAYANIWRGLLRVRPERGAASTSSQGR